jgi:hypothetical protein
MSAQLDKETLEIISKAAVQAVMEHMEAERLKLQKSRKDRRLRNTKMLLRNYRAFVIHCRDVAADLEKLNDAELLEELDTEELALESIKRSKKRTLAMVQYVDHMLEVYRIICERSGKPEDMRRFQVLHGMYIAESKEPVEDIAQRQSIDSRTVYKDLHRACESLSGLIFGIDGVRMWGN